MHEGTYSIPWITGLHGALVEADPFAASGAASGAASALIAGQAGFGKSVAAHLWLARLMARGAQAVILNGAPTSTAWLERTAQERGLVVAHGTVMMERDDCDADDLTFTMNHIDDPRLNPEIDLFVYDTYPLLPGTREAWYVEALAALTQQRRAQPERARPLVVLLDNTEHPDPGAFAAALRSTAAWSSLRMHLWLVVESLNELAVCDLETLWHSASIRALFHQSHTPAMALAADAWNADHLDSGMLAHLAPREMALWLPGQTVTVGSVTALDAT